MKTGDGQVTRPVSDDAPELAGIGGAKEQATDSRDCAKQLTGSLARLALLGIEARHLHADTWALIASSGASIGVVRGVDALTAAAAGFEQVQADVLRMLGVQ